MSSTALHRRFVSASPTGPLTSTRHETSQYISPTYQSSIFNHSQENRSVSTLSTRERNMSPTFRSSIFYSGQDQSLSVEDSRIAAKRARRVDRDNGVLPTVDEWNPKRSDINNPDVHEKIELDALANTKKKIEKDVSEYRSRRERRNQVVKDDLKEVDKKMDARLDSKKPSEADKKAYKQSEEERCGEMRERMNKASVVRERLNKTLEKQIEEKVRQKQQDFENQKNDLRTGLQLKPRKEYDIEEYKIGLKRQFAEKEQKKSQEERNKKEEVDERLKDIKSQEEIMSSLKDKFLLKKSKSVAFVDSDLRNSKTEQSPLYGTQNSAETENIQLRNFSSIGRRQRSDIFQAQKSFEERPKKGASQIGDILNAWPTKEDRRAKVPVSPQNIRNPIVKANWNETASELIKKKEEQQDLLQGLKNQIVSKQKSKEYETQKEKEDGKLTGLKLKAYQPKETIYHVAEIVKNQIREKEDVQKKDRRLKKEELNKTKEAQRIYENNQRKEFETLKEKRIETVTFYKKEIVAKAAVKKHKGLMTVKIN